MTWQTICDPAFSSRLCLTLFHSLWQVALLSAAAWAFDRLRPRRSVESSYVLHVAALLAGLAVFPITFALVDAGTPGVVENRTSTANAAVAESPRSVSLDTTGMPPPLHPGDSEAKTTSAETASQPPATAAVATTARESSALWPRLAPWIIAFYAAGVSIMLARLLRGMRQAQRLASRAGPIGEGALVEMVRAIARKWSMRVAPVVARAEGIIVPKVVGLVRPTILMPISAIGGLSAGELELILAHELAHVRRFDLWVNLMQRVAETMLFFNPGLWYLSRRIAALREYCCDELACRAADGSDAARRTRYAAALLRIVELARPGTAAADLAALAAGGRTPSELRRRVARLFGEPLAEPLRLSRGGLIALAVVAVVLLTLPSAWHSAAQSAAPAANGNKQFEIFVVGPDGKAVPDAAIEIRGDVPLAENELLRGHFVKKKSYGTEFKADPDGRLAVRLPKQPERFQVGINLPGFGPYWAQWGRSQAIPERFTAELDGAWSVGGVVVDADGSPIEGVSIRPSIEYKKRPGDNGQLRVGARIMTDAEGRWQYDSVPESMNEVFAEINHPSYEPLRRPLTRIEFGVRPGERPAARIRLERGATVVGKITDDAGKPIAGALVRTQFLNDIRKAETDENGAYRLVGCEPTMAKIVVTAKGKAMDMKEVRITPNLGPVDFTLKPGGTIRVRVLKPDGQPAAKTRIFFQRWRGEHVYFAFDNVNQYADTDGRWQWDEAPPDEIKADICPPGGMQILEQTLGARDEEYVFRAIPALVISGSVVDAETKKPVPSFRVVRGIRGYDEPNARSGKTHVDWVRPESYMATGGRYEVRPKRAYMAHLIRIEAEGYRTAVSRDIQSDEGMVQVDFALERAADIAATVLTPDGQPAAGAKIALGIAGSQISVKNGVFDGSTSAARCDTDDAGRFHFPMPEGPYQLVILHPAGYAYLKSAEKKTAGSITLTAWARVEGTFRVGSKPMGNVPIAINTGTVSSYGKDVPNIFTHHYVTCDPDGRFVLERVFPGDGWIGRRLMLTVADGAEDVTSSAMMPANFPAGKTTHIDLGGAGRAVAGRLAPPASFQGQALWNFALVDAAIDAAMPGMPTPPADLQDDPAKRKEWWNQWFHSPQGQAWQKARDAAGKVRRTNPRFTATVARDGSFRIDDVPPGRYVLNVRFSEHAAGRLTGFRFTVPEAGEAQHGQPIALGVLTLQ